ncbi:helicase [Sphingobacterium sp. SGG-5]|uniref:helicase-related protein n=1 Tax=Sphingobacterium sp. SGG-5 TaxID=2710881 RepID=UPI0013EAAA45|nr:DEAD/DEAH box helicase [Sphingobacterium sp. SGG-5]NGM63538.1 helicase [Sphingobacterium sp. SGG-5]
MDYKEFLKSKEIQFSHSGFEISELDLNPMLKDFQVYGVSTALRKGKFALFFDCGLGKTFCQLEWSRHVTRHTNAPVLILAPLAIVQQTIDEGRKFGIDVYRYDSECTPCINEPDIFICNYDQLKNIDTSVFAGIVLDESSILKGRDGKLSSSIIQSFRNTPYKLACTATPSPNDHMELGQHSEFLGGMTYLEMLAMYFVHDGGQTSKWRLRKHAEDDFWKYVCTWSIAIDTPTTLGFDGTGYDLPEIEYIEHIIDVENNTNTLFGDVAVSATDLHKDLRRSFDARIDKTVELVNSNNEQWIVWALSNQETDTLKKVLPEAVNVQGSDTAEFKAKHLNGFAKNDFRTLITKTSIAAMGMNYQNCHNIVFTSYDFKFEQFYQAVRRCYRFGQTEKVMVHLLIPSSQINVRSTILEKQANHFNMIRQMAKYSATNDYKRNKPEREYKQAAIQLPKFAC